MIKRQRKAILLVALACLVVLICTAQRMAGMHALVMNATASSQSVQQGQESSDAPVNTSTPQTRAFLRPSRSASRPHGTRNAANTML